MAKENKRKLSIATVMILMMLAFSAYATLAPTAHAAGATVQEKGLSILNDVVGLDTVKYDVATTQYPNDMYRDNLPRENVRAILDTAGSKVDALCTFINGSLQKIYVCSKEGSPLMNTLTTSDVTMAQNFLTNYEAQSKNSLYGELNLILSKADVTKNSSITIGNTKLNVTVLEKDTTFRWTYVANGIEAPDKCVALRYTDGFLNYFIDDWDLYKIGSTSVNLSEKDAIDIAMDRAKNYSPDSNEIGTIGGIRFNVTNAMVIERFLAPAIYAGADAVRSEDPLELYPMYNVWVSLDKFYPGNVYGFNVYIWADTKEVYYINQRISTIDPPDGLVASATDSTYPSDNQTVIPTTVLNANDSLSIILVVLPACAAGMFVMLPIYLGIKKKTASLLPLPKARCLKISGILLCLLMFSPLLIAISAQPVAGANVGGASIWGSESTGSRNPPTTGESWRKSNSEVTLQRDTALYINGLFSANGYVSTNNQGSNCYGSGREAILSVVRSLEQNYPQYVVVDFDHGVGTNINNVFHYMFEDNTGTKLGTAWPGTAANENAVYDYVLYGNTTGNAFFAFINTCMSADYNNAHHALDNDTYSNYKQGMLPDGTARGMAFAWTHRIVATNPVGNQMSSDGYHATDNGDNCYIGFDFGSAALNQTVENSDYQYYCWVYHFFYYALAYDYTIHTALDLASQDMFYYHPNFDESKLYTGFEAIWRQYINGTWQDSWEGWNFTMSDCTMKVYGNAYLKLYQPLLTLSASDGLSPQFTIDGQSYSTGNHRVISDDYTINVNDIPNYSFSHFSYNDNNYGRPATIQIAHDSELTAVYNWNPTYYTLSISSTGGGHTDPSGDQQYLSYTPAHVVAVPDNSSWVFDSWRLDGNNAGTNPSIYVNMDGPHTLQAIFVPPPPYYFVPSIHDYGCDGFQAGVSDTDNLIGISNDGQYATLYAGAYYDEAWIIGNMNTQATGHIKLYGSGYSNHLRVYVSNDGSNYNLVSDQYVSQGSPDWIDCGFYSGTFNYIAVDVYSDPPPSYIYVDSVRVDPPANYTLTISSGSGGSTTPSPGAYQYTEGTPVAVTANPDSGYALDYWLLDGQNAGSQNPITVTMNSDHSLQAIFQSSQHSLTVLAYNQYSEPGYVPLYIDGQYVGTTGYAYSVTDGNHQIYVESPLTDWYSYYHEFQYYYYDGNYNYNNPMTLSVTSDKTVTAYYYSYYM